MLWNFKKRTFVYVFHNKAPFDRWVSAVLYDAWGHPTVRDAITPSAPRHRLHGDGTSDNECSWTFKSGPPVIFPPANEVAA